MKVGDEINGEIITGIVNLYGTTFYYTPKAIYNSDLKKLKRARLFQRIKWWVKGLSVYKYKFYDPKNNSGKCS